MYYLCSENKGADQLRGCREADLHLCFCKIVLCKKPGFSQRGSNTKIYVYAPNFEKVGDILVSACPCVCVCVCIHVRDIVFKLHVWIPHGKIADAYFWFSLNYLPLSNYGPLTNKGMKFCKCRISKSIIARNLKLVMLIGDDDSNI